MPPVSHLPTPMPIRTRVFEIIRFVSLSTMVNHSHHRLLYRYRYSQMKNFVFYESSDQSKHTRTWHSVNENIIRVVLIHEKWPGPDAAHSTRPIRNFSGRCTPVRPVPSSIEHVIFFCFGTDPCSATQCPCEPVCVVEHVAHIGHFFDVPLRDVDVEPVCITEH